MAGLVRFPNTEYLVSLACRRLYPNELQMTPAQLRVTAYNLQGYYACNIFLVVVVASAIFPLIGLMSVSTAAWVGGWAYAARINLMIGLIGLEEDHPQKPHIGYLLARLIGFIGTANTRASGNVLEHLGVSRDSYRDWKATARILWMVFYQKAPYPLSDEGWHPRVMIPPHAVSPVREAGGRGVGAVAAVAEAGLPQSIEGCPH